jgi:predicted metal-dependent HD superfamily phosphohydrolase
MLSPPPLAPLQQGWARLLGRYVVSPAAAYPVFDRLVARYSDPHRHYHNLEHIGEMLKVVGSLKDLARDIAAIELAVWFHDAVYDPRAKNNEERSAELAKSELHPLGISSALVDRLTALILATKHSGGEPPDIDTAILVDADLAILSADESRYDRYASAIRHEYDWVNVADYRTGRSAVLRHFLSLSRIYQTASMLEVGEATARANLRRELTHLESA